MIQADGVQLTEATLEALEELEAATTGREKLIERAVLAYLEQWRRQRRDLRDRRILDERAEALNREAHDVLAFQVEA